MEQAMHPAAGELKFPAFSYHPDSECSAEEQMTMKEFVEYMFVPEHVVHKGKAGRTHYQAILKHVLTPEVVERIFQSDSEKSKLKALADWPYLDEVRVVDARPEDVQRLVSAAIDRGYSTQTVTHIRNVVSAIFSHAMKKPWFQGDNPALLVPLPAMTRKEARALTLAQARQVLRLMQYPEKQMTLAAILTSMNVAEICGLQWKYVNLTDTWREVDGEAIPARTISIRKQWNRGELSPLEQKSRCRNLPIPEMLLSVLKDLQQRSEFNAPDDFVLVSRNGKAINMNNIRAHRLKPIGAIMQMPWLSWQVLQRTHTNLANELGKHFLMTVQTLC